MEARVGKCEKCCFHFSSIYLFLVNLIDFGLACALLSFSMYLWSKLGASWSQPQTSWFLWCTAIISILLFVVSIFSFMSMTSSSCRSFAKFTDFVAVIIVLLDLAVGIASVRLKPLILDYITDHQDETGLTDKDLQIVKTWYIFVAFAFFASLILEALRVWFNRGYGDTARRMDREFDALLAEDERDWDLRMENKAQETSEKYSALRAYYKQKYSRKAEDNKV